MENIRKQCYQILDSIEKSQWKEKDSYSIVRIKRAVKQLLDEIDDKDSVKKVTINIPSLSRNFVDDTGDYSSIILKELELLSKELKLQFSEEG